MTAFRSKAVFKAVQWNKEGDDARVYYREKVGQAWIQALSSHPNAKPVIDTPKGWMFVLPGQWILTDELGSVHLMSPEQFTRHYESAAPAAEAAQRVADFLSVLDKVNPEHPDLMLITGAATPLLKSDLRALADAGKAYGA